MTLPLYQHLNQSESCGSKVLATLCVDFCVMSLTSMANTLKPNPV
jgi:hypothetical protein